MRSLVHLPELDSYGDRLAKLSMQPLRVRVSTLTPVASNDPVALDSLLAYAVVTEAMQGRIFPRVDAPVWQPLPLAMEKLIDGLPLWQSTDFRPINLVRGSTHIHRRTGDNPYAMQALKNTLNEKRPRRYPNELAGPYMNFRVPERRHVAEAWEATCVGNYSEVTRLLSYIRYFGKAFKRGCGLVNEWRVETMNEPFAFYDELGQPKRPIPVDENILGIGSQQGWTPPYWLKETWRMCLSSSVSRLI
jgi:CRISPR type IV-associated protein Csf3